MPQVLVEHDPSPMKLEVLGAEDWPLVTDGVGTETRDYPTTETSYILEGHAEIRVDGEGDISIGPGDLVTVMPQTHCVWNITKAIQRHYSIG